jgi:hypothetical protein
LHGGPVVRGAFAGSPAGPWEAFVGGPGGPTLEAAAKASSPDHTPTPAHYPRPGPARHPGPAATARNESFCFIRPATPGGHRPSPQPALWLVWEAREGRQAADNLSTQRRPSRASHKSERRTSSRRRLGRRFKGSGMICRGRKYL